MPEGVSSLDKYPSKTIQLPVLRAVLTCTWHNEETRWTQKLSPSACIFLIILGLPSYRLHVLLWPVHTAAADKTKTVLSRLRQRCEQAIMRTSWQNCLTLYHLWMSVSSIRYTSNITWPISTPFSHILIFKLYPTFIQFERFPTSR